MAENEMKRKRFNKKTKRTKYNPKKTIPFSNGFCNDTNRYLQKHRIPEDCHKLTLDEFMRRMKYNTGEHKHDKQNNVFHDLLTLHMKLITRAMRKGRKIPSSVLHDYPTIWQRYIQYE
jgi:hypothetical protein